MCKKGAKFENKCYHKDGLTPILEKIKSSDGFIIGTPIYIGLPSSLSHKFFERAIFSSCAYRKDMSVFGKKIPTGLIATMGAPEQWAKETYQPLFDMLTGRLGLTFGSCELVRSHDTLQVEDYSQYDIQIADPKEKQRIRREQFPIDLLNAFEMGRRIGSPKN
jgi:multimeric flavodoxin WrbA